MEKEIIIDNVLCYVSTARHTLKNDDILQTCLAFYKEEEIIKAKDLLCDIVGEKSKRRRNENRVLNELKDIMEMLCKSDEKNVSLPKFVVEKYDGLPPTSGFEVVANSVNGLLKEVENLRNEINLLKISRIEEEAVKQDHVHFKEDIITIKGELRKLNHKLLGDEIRKDYFTLDSLSNITHRNNADQVKRPLDLHHDIQANKSCNAILEEFMNFDETSCSPGAPPASQEAWGLLAREFQDEGGSPSAPTLQDIIRQEKEELRAKTSKGRNDLGARKKDSSSHKPLETVPVIPALEHKNGPVFDSDGFQKVENKKKTRKNIIGSKRTDDYRGIVKGAARTADLYLGNCDLGVNEEAISRYINEELNVKVVKCEELTSRNVNCKSFKVTMNMNEREKLLLSEVWPEGIICRKFYNARKSS